MENLFLRDGLANIDNFVVVNNKFEKKYSHKKNIYIFMENPDS
jgi:hypothetical protein